MMFTNKEVVYLIHIMKQIEKIANFCQIIITFSESSMPLF